MGMTIKYTFLIGLLMIKWNNVSKVHSRPSINSQSTSQTFLTQYKFSVYHKHGPRLVPVCVQHPIQKSGKPRHQTILMGMRDLLEEGWISGGQARWDHSLIISLYFVEPLSASTRHLSKRTLGKNVYRSRNLNVIQINFLETECAVKYGVATSNLRTLVPLFWHMISNILKTN